MVRTDGPDGKLSRLPDQLHLRRLSAAAVPDRLPRRALPDAADRLGCAAEGRRRAALVPPLSRAEGRPHSDPLHWTGVYQNWALQCAECHSTNLRKGYDPASHTYHTTYSEINVACEACHGPGSAHVEWAGRPAAL
jgi:hypothetical protein